MSVLLKVDPRPCPLSAGILVEISALERDVHVRVMALNVDVPLEIGRQEVVDGRLGLLHLVSVLRERRAAGEQNAGGEEEQDFHGKY